MMIDIEDKLMTAWVSLLNGNISVPVFDTSIPDHEAQEDSYVELRFESETEVPISSRFWTNAILITDVITRFKTIIDPKIARAINSEIIELLANVTGNNLPVQSGIQIGNVYKQSATSLQEFDGSKYYYRIVTRYKHDIIQPQN